VEDAIDTGFLFHVPASVQGEVLVVRDLATVRRRLRISPVAWNVPIEGSEAAPGVMAVRHEDEILVWSSRHIQQA
jgi:hypothetical protein